MLVAIGHLILALVLSVGGLVAIGYGCVRMLGKPSLVFIISEIMGTIYIGALIVLTAVLLADRPGGGDFVMSIVLAPIIALLFSAWAASYASSIQSTQNGARNNPQRKSHVGRILIVVGILVFIAFVRVALNI